MGQPAFHPDGSFATDDGLSTIECNNVGAGDPPQWVSASFFSTTQHFLTEVSAISAGICAALFRLGRSN